MRSGLPLVLVTILLLIVGQQTQGANQQANSTPGQSTAIGSNDTLVILSHSSQCPSHSSPRP
ncbi:hypothetical protein E2C01_030446 [Portunus trituberculatus]|uniref:Uncharacterized protein n=1 Tax=Portunus trituberculatus TaxID=210409 RepID=A0A5B7EXB9_PORTR|nr:hypothetical protein [Portunus trituberculatus]